VTNVDIAYLLLRGADEIDYAALDDELLGALALQTDEPFIATLALGEMARRRPARGREIAEVILERAAWDDYLTASAVEILFARDPEAARREMSRLVETTAHPAVLEAMAENVMSDRPRFDDAAGKDFVARLAGKLARAEAKRLSNRELVSDFLQRYAPGSERR
jgi:hypothetical protein